MPNSISGNDRGTCAFCRKLQKFRKSGLGAQSFIYSDGDVVNSDSQEVPQAEVAEHCRLLQTPGLSIFVMLCNAEALED